MFRISKLLCSFAIAALLFSLSTGVQKTYAYQPIDQVNSNSLDGWWRINSHQWVGQTFTPSKNRLDAIGIKVSGNGAPGVLRLFLYDLYEIKILSIVEIPIGATEKWVYYDFPEDIVINSYGKTHAIYLSSETTDAYWTVSMSNTYAGGNAIVDSKADANEDFGFATYGYDYEAPASEEGDPIIDDGGGEAVEQTSNNTGGEQVVTPASEPTKNIAAPTAVKAEDVPNDDGQAVKISWKASTATDISGYKIYRSTSSATDFVAVGTTPKSELEFVDESVELGKTCYYYVRSYKDKAESANSNVTKIVSVDNKAPAEPQNFYIGSKGAKVLNFSWAKNSEKDLAGYILKVYKMGVDTKAEGAVEIKSFDLAKDRDKYALDFSVDNLLSIDTEYDYYLLAKDVSGNMSEMVKATDEPEQEVAEASAEEDTLFTTQNYLLAAGALLVLALATYLIVAAVKRKRAKKNQAAAPQNQV